MRNQLLDAPPRAPVSAHTTPIRSSKLLVRKQSANLLIGRGALLATAPTLAMRKRQQLQAITRQSVREQWVNRPSHRSLVARFKQVSHCFSQRAFRRRTKPASLDKAQTRHPHR